jgi:hypothetical protein
VFEALAEGELMTSVFVVGTNHGIQRGESLKDDFKSYVTHLCLANNINVIAEEINDDAEYVVAKDVCEELSICHKIIDPNPRDYDRLGVTEYHKIVYEIMRRHDLELSPSIDNGSPQKALDEFESRKRVEHHRPREIEWLRRIQENDTWPVLVICGADHFDSFYKLLLQNGIKTTRADPNWGC